MNNQEPLINGENAETEALDGNPNLEKAVFSDESVLIKAPHYNIDLNSLEDFAAGSQGPVAENNTDDLKAERVKAHYFWQDLDVGLGEVVKKLISSSERPVFIVSDDKIAFLNRSAMEVLEINTHKLAVEKNFLTYVDQEDWNLLAENIGEMLTEEKSLRIKLKSISGKVNAWEFQAIYLPDSNHFSFILIGNHQQKPEAPLFNSLYDERTSLPNFFLFEDRVQMAVNNENCKDIRLPKSLIAVIAISIDNLDSFRKLRLEDFALRKLAGHLALSMKKNYTAARGLRYQFWILLPDIANERVLEMEIDKINAVFNEGVNDNFTTHEVITSIGVSVFPNPAQSAKRLIEQAIAAVKKAKEIKGNSFVMYDGN